MRITPKILKLVAPLILGALPLFSDVMGADGVKVKLSGRERILMPPTSDAEKEWEKTDRLFGSKQQPSEPNASFIPSGGVSVQKDPILLKFISERQTWLSPKGESDSGPSAEEKALGVRDYSGKSAGSGFIGEPENTKATSKAQKKDPLTPSDWETSANPNSWRFSKTNPKQNASDQSDTANKAYSSSSTLPSITASPLPDFYRIGESRANLSSRTATSAQFSSPTDLGAMPGLPDGGSLMKMDKARQIELQKKAQFQQLLQPKGPGAETLAGANDPVNIWQDSGRAEANPVTGSSLDDVTGRNRNDLFGFSQQGGPALHSGRSSFLDGLDPKLSGQNSLTPILAPIAAPEFKAKPGVLEIPIRRKF